MQIATGIVVYFMIWWIVLLVLLPIGVKPSKMIQQGNASSAPENSHIKKKFLITSFISFFLFGLIYLLIDYEVFSFRSLVASNPKW